MRLIFPICLSTSLFEKLLLVRIHTLVRSRLSFCSGARKWLPDGMRLRGDINVLLLGDPSVAKSQFLKFAMQVVI